MMGDELLTLEEVAALLKVDKKTIYRMTQGMELPAFKIRGLWRFRKTDINDWINRQVDRSTNTDLKR